MLKEVTFWKEAKTVKSRPKMTATTNKPKQNCYQGKKLDRASAVYVEGTQFMCSRCLYYRGGSCAIVKGSIAPAGCCNLFYNQKMTYKK